MAEGDVNGWIEITLPLLEWPSNSLAVTLPFLTVASELRPGGTISVDIPLSQLSITGLTGEIGSVGVTLGWPRIADNYGDMLTPSMYGGGRLSLEIPLLTSAQNGIVGNVYNLDITLELMTVLLNSQYSNVIGSIDLDLPVFTTGIAMPQSIIGSIVGVIPKPYFNYTGKVGQVGSINIDVPLIEYDLTAYASGAGTIDVTFPVIVTDSYGTSTPATISYKAFVVNTKNFGVSTYSNYQFNSITDFNGRKIGALGSNIYVLGGPTDAGEEITSNVKFGNLNISKPVLMLPRDMWITMRSGKQVRVRVLENEKDDSNIYEYVSEEFVDDLRQSRVKLGRGLRGQSLRFEVENIDGEDFDIESIHLLSGILRKKR